jgi:transcriptional regulator with XRE-family HTH domain
MTKTETPSSQISARLRKAREKRGYKTASAFAREMGIDPEQTYINQENGSRGLTTTNARKYAKKLKINLDWLLDGTGEMDSKKGTLNDPSQAMLYPPDVGIEGHEISAGNSHNDTVSARRHARMTEDKIVNLCENLPEEAKAKLDIPMLMTMIYEACGREVPLSLHAKKNKTTG